jgi:hypothetical protein
MVLINNKELVMIRRIFLTTLMGMICFVNNLNAINPYLSLQSRVINFGKTLDEMSLPLIGKPAHLLPIAMIAAGFQKCPGQTMLVLAGLVAYVLAHNETFRSLLREYNIIGGPANQGSSETDLTDIDDTLFVFDGEDDEDAQEQSDTEDELLGENLLEEEQDEQLKNKQLIIQQKPVIKLL